MKVKDILKIMDAWAPFDTAEEWDNVGLLVGNGDDEVKGILIALDITREVIEEAVSLGANLIVTHHPVIFNDMKTVTESASQERHVIALVRNGISVISAHTNLDMAEGGISDVMAEKIGLINATTPEADALFRVGELPEEASPQEFAKRVSSAFLSKRVLAAGSPPEKIKKVCVMGGSGGKYIERAKKTDADVFLLGSVQHDQAISAHTLGVYTVTAGHYETEVIILPKIVAYLQKHADDVQSLNGINISKSGKNPFNIIF